VPGKRLEPYCWPLKPFGRAHPVRAYLNDPRISGNSRAFHFGIDISAPDGAPVYAVEGGTVHLEGGRSLSVVSPASGRAFGYWHVIPAVAHHETVDPQQLLGHVEAPWGHLHFAEVWRKAYRNPLRPGALAPWSDTNAPHITAIELYDGNRKLPPGKVCGAVDVIVEASATPPLAVPAPWAAMPVSPAVIRWRVRRGNKTVRSWHTPVDLRLRMLDQDQFAKVYAPGTRQNHPNKPGRYRYYLAHTWSTKLLPNGTYELDVEAANVGGHKSTATLAFTIAN
jgi:hypothetical protein